MTPERWKKIEQLCSAALEREPNQRVAFLLQACGGDDELRWDVESLLAQEKPADRFLESSDAEIAAKQLARGLGDGGGKLIGKQLGSYQIVSLVGAGGMGEVYRARDTRLDRTVAIKVLPERLADRADLRERFEREARTIASLNHPHICTLYDVGRQDGTEFLVMEYLEGETLAQRLKKGALPLAQVMQYAIEIADALDKAHRKGITHRDLKPGNIMLTKSGAKLLDFGLAKLRPGSGARTPLSELPTEKSDVTATGTILGTLQYMAPEQLEGKEADGRTDIFAFGAVVYEMATGKKAFEGKSQASLIAKILETEPAPISSLQPMAPPALERVVKRCLAKDPDERWQAARDLEVELKWIVEGGSQVGAAPVSGATGAGGLGRRAVITIVGSSMLVGLIAALATWMLKPVPNPPKPVSRFTITLPPGQQFEVPENGPVLAVSPDGTHLAYAAQQGGTQQIYLRAMDSLDARPLPGTEIATGAITDAVPFFSPDSQWLGFFLRGKLMKISVNGGPAVTLCENLGVPSGATWSSQGTIILGNGGAGPLLQVPETGGKPQPLTRLERGEISHVWPELLPGGNAVLFVADTSGNDIATGGIVVQSLGTGERRNLIQGTYGRYANSGHIVYMQAGTLMAVPFDLHQLKISGPAAPIIEGVLQSVRAGDAQYAVSSSGSLAYVRGPVQSAQLKMVWVSRSGTEQPLAAPAHAYRDPRLSPDGRRIAAGITEQDSQVWLYDLSRETLTRFTFESDNNTAPFWTPDGKRIVYISNKDGPRNLYWQLADGSGGLERLTTSDHVNIPSSWSPDGRMLAYSELGTPDGYDIWVLRLSDRKTQPFLKTKFNEAAAQFSPDGNWVAYASDESGRNEIYVQPYPGPGGKWQISTVGGREPLWNRNGRELFYRNGNKMMAVEIALKPSFSAGTPKMLFEGQYQSLPGMSTPNYDVSPDGQRFLMLRADQQDISARQINVVLNWFEELKRRAPAGK